MPGELKNVEGVKNSKNLYAERMLLTFVRGMIFAFVKYI
jgi:hypothetical protein